MADSQIVDNGFAFVATPETTKIRKQIDEFKGCSATYMRVISPKIQCLDYIHSSSVCYSYALGQVFKTYKEPHIRLTEVNTGNIHILHHCFTVTTQPQKGDLVVYYDSSGFPVHWGIYISGDVIESKWGSSAVFRHPPFYVGNNYGHFIKCFRLNGDPETALKSLEAFQNNNL